MRILIRTSKREPRVEFALQIDRRLGLALLPIATGLIAQLSIAAPTDTGWIQKNQPVSAMLLKGNLDDLQKQISALESPADRVVIQYASGKSYSIGATYCDSTAASKGQVAGGYAGVKALCEATSGCGASAHLCSAEEIMRSAALGVSVPDGWYGTGTWVKDVAPEINDCLHWTSTTPSFEGPHLTNGSPYGATCDTMHAFLCCD